MTDTLPADLRRHAERRTLSLPVAETMLRAADEIEQLRAERGAPAVGGDAGWPDWRHHDTTEERRRIMSRALDAADPLRRPVSGDRIEAALSTIKAMETAELVKRDQHRLGGDKEMYPNSTRSSAGLSRGKRRIVPSPRRSRPRDGWVDRLGNSGSGHSCGMPNRPIPFWRQACPKD